MAKKAKGPASENKGGRPSIYTPELAAEIFKRLCEPRSLRSVCDDEDMPTRQTVLHWVVTDAKGKPWSGFSYHYAQARQVQAHIWAEEITDIADDSGFDAKVTENGIVVDGEAIQRARLRVDTRKWMLSKVLPKVYGDRVAHEVTGKDGGPMQVEVTRQVVPATKNRIAAAANVGNGNGHP
jgi:hypothetical protein